MTTNKYRLVLLSFFLLNISCNPRVVSLAENSPKLDAWDEKLGFVIYEEEESADIEEFVELGRIKVTDTGFSVDCDYYSVINKLKKSAMEKGGNFVKIDKHKEPDLISSCHRIHGTVYHVEDLWKYEKEFEWSSHRKLRPRDFKGDSKNRPNSSRTIATIRYFFESDAWKNQQLLIINCYFDCEHSYFNKVNADPLEMRVQQYIFDLAEINARNIKRDLMVKKVNNARKLNAQYPEIYETNMENLDIETDRLISEIMNDSSKEDFWVNYIAKSLEETEEYANVKIPLRM